MRSFKIGQKVRIKIPADISEENDLGNKYDFVEGMRDYDGEIATITEVGLNFHSINIDRQWEWHKNMLKPIEKKKLYVRDLLRVMENE